MAVPGWVWSAVIQLRAFFLSISVNLSSRIHFTIPLAFLIKRYKIASRANERTVEQLFFLILV